MIAPSVAPAQEVVDETPTALVIDNLFISPAPLNITEITAAPEPEKEPLLYSDTAKTHPLFEGISLPSNTETLTSKT
jgi:hypothetical protein